MGLSQMMGRVGGMLPEEWKPERKVFYAGLSSLATTGVVAALSRGKPRRFSRRKATKLVTSLAGLASAIPPVVAYVTANKPGPAVAQAMPPGALSG